MNMENLFSDSVRDHESCVQRVRGSHELIDGISVVGGMVLAAFRSGNKLLLCGNGGSAADAQHIATELVARFYLERPALDAEALSVNTSSITAIGNDYSFDRVFARQVEAKGKPGDVLIGITTSGTSKNIIAAFKAGRTIGLKNVCLTGEKAPASLDELCDAVIRVPTSCTPRIQEVHILLGHILCEYVERELFEKR